MPPAKKSLTSGIANDIVNIMNEKAPINVSPDAPPAFQVTRLKELITDMVKCCEDRRIYEHARFGLPYAELRCLMLFDGERYLTVKGIARKMDVAKSRVTKIVEQLLKKNYITKLDDPADARVKLIGLTPAGREKVRQVDDFYKEIHREILQQIHAEDRKTLLSYLEILHGAMETVKARLV